MKKLLFILAFAFIGQQAFSQIYIVTITTDQLNSASPCYALGTMTTVMHTIDPQGNVSTICLSYRGAGHNAEDISIINLEFNSIINQGYRLVPNSLGNLHDASGQWGSASIEGTYYFAIPWNTIGLEEVSTTLKSLNISPNPANDFLDINLSYDLKGESEVVFISEVGYVASKQRIGDFLKNEKYKIDISKIPSGKYLVTIVNGKTYTTPQKLIIY